MNSLQHILFRAGSSLLAVGIVASCAKPPARERPPEETAPVEEEASGPLERSDSVTLSAEALESSPLTYARAEVKALSESIVAPAEVVAVPDRMATIGPRVAGRVVAVNTNVGDPVERGATLVTLESEKVGQAWAEFIAARARERVARRALERQRRLLKDRITSQRAVEEAAGTLQIAEADLQAARTRLRTFGVQASETLPANPAHVALTSPISGTVVTRSVHVGQWVEPSETIVEVVDLDELWLRATIYERDMGFIHVGQPMDVEVRAFPQEVFQGEIEQIDGMVDKQNRTIGVRAVLPNPDHRLRPGMFATARIRRSDGRKQRATLAIPWESVQQINNHPAVFVKVEEGVFEVRRIHTGDRAGRFIEVLNGLDAGDEVVVDGSFLLKGQLLRSTLGEDE